jgi:hypothetical protein
MASASHPALSKSTARKQQVSSSRMLSESAVSGAGGRLGRVETTHRLRRIGLEAGRFETLPLQIVDGIEVRIDGRKRHLVLDAQSRDPEVVLWNRLALLPESEAQFSVNLGGGDRDVRTTQRVTSASTLARFWPAFRELRAP